MRLQKALHIAEVLGGAGRITGCARLLSTPQLCLHPSGLSGSEIRTIRCEHTGLARFVGTERIELALRLVERAQKRRAAVAAWSRVTTSRRNAVERCGEQHEHCGHWISKRGRVALRGLRHLLKCHAAPHGMPRATR
jgi:hypothetical protein